METTSVRGRLLMTTLDLLREMAIPLQRSESRHEQWHIRPHRCTLYTPCSPTKSSISNPIKRRSRHDISLLLPTRRAIQMVRERGVGIVMEISLQVLEKIRAQMTMRA